MKRRKQQRSYNLETLEVRTLLTGNVTALMIGGDLVIVGDVQDNAFRVRSSGDGVEVVVEGFDGTMVNGGTTARFPIGGLTDDIRMSLGGGDNQAVVGFLEVPDDVIVRGGSGSDAVAVLANSIEGDVKMNLGGGADTAVLGSAVGGNTRINTAGGADKVSVGFDFIGFEGGGDLNISTGGGGDDVTVSNALIGDDLSLRTGGGNDRVFIDASEANDRLSANLGGGADRLWIRNTLSDGPMVLSGGGGRDGIRTSGAYSGSTTTVSSFEYTSSMASADRDALFAEIEGVFDRID